MVLKPITKELEHAFNINEKLGDSSKVIYRSVYRRFLNLSDHTKLLDMSEANIIKLVNDDSIPPKSQESLLDVAVLVRKANNASYEKILKYKTIQLKKSIEKRKFEKNEKLKDELPEKKQIERYIKTLENNKDYVSYIVNYLLLNYGVRNLDLNLIITSDRDVTTKGHKSEINYLYVTSTYVIYIRNNYKTYKTYGQKKLKIIKKSFLNACKQLLGDNYDTPLLKLKNGDPISEESIGRVIQEMTYNNIGESMYFKINIADSKKANNIKRIRDLSNHRGSALETVFAEYDIDNKN